MKNDGYSLRSYNYESGAGVPPFIIPFSIFIFQYSLFELHEGE